MCRENETATESDMMNTESDSLPHSKTKVNRLQERLRIGWAAVLIIAASMVLYSWLISYSNDLMNMSWDSRLLLTR